MLAACLTARLCVPPRRSVQEQSSLLVANVAKFNKWFNVDVHESTEVCAQ